MATRGESGWQYNRTVQECNRYMLDNEIATDVCLEVGQSEEGVVNIRAHRYMLVSRSAVFEALFCSGMSEMQATDREAKIRITDIDPDVFREILRFIYCDEAEVTPTNALPLMYAGKKYLLPQLVQRCSKCLKDDLSLENVCDILNLSLIFDEDELKTDCIQLISKNPSDALSPEMLHKMSYQALEAVLQSDSMAEDETFLYETCLQWGRIQLLNQAITCPTDEQIRRTLGDLIYLVRFPVMEAKDFAAIVEKSCILSHEEQSSIFCFIASNRKREGMRFNCRPRLGKIFGKEEFVDRSGRHSVSWASGPDAIDFRTDKRVLLTGLGLYTESKANGSGFTVDLEVYNSTERLYKKSATVPFTGSPTPFKVPFETPVTLLPGTVYTLVAVSSPGKNLFFAGSCHPVCVKGNVTITFSASMRTNNGTDAIQGQFPRLYFRPTTR